MTLPLNPSHNPLAANADVFWNIVPGATLFQMPAKCCLCVLRGYRKITIAQNQISGGMEGIVKGAFFDVLVEVNDTVKETFATAASILIVQDLLLRHFELAEACQDLKKAVQGVFPYCEKRSWNTVPTRCDFSRYYKPAFEKLKKLVYLIGRIIQKFFLLLAPYLTTYDLYSTGPQSEKFRLEAIKEVCINPWQVLPKFDENQIQLKHLLKNSIYLEMVQTILKNSRFHSVETLQQKICDILEIPRNVVEKIKKTTSILSRFIILSPSNALKQENREFYQKQYKELGLKGGTEDFMEPQPYAPYIGARLPKKEVKNQWVLKEKDFDNFRSPPPKTPSTNAKKGVFNSQSVLSSLFDVVYDYGQSAYNTVYEITEEYVMPNTTPKKKSDFKF